MVQGLNPRAPLNQAPSHELSGKADELKLHDQIGQMRTWVGDASRELVATDAGENGPVASTADGICALGVKLLTKAEGSGQRAKVCTCKRIRGSPESAAVNVDARPSPLRLDLLKVSPVVPARLGLVVVGERVEARCFRSLFRENVVRHADNRRRVQAAAHFAEDRRIRPQPPLNGLTEHKAKVLLIFRIRLVANARRRVKAPEAFDHGTAISNADELPGRHLANFEIWRQTGIRVMRQVSSDVVIIDVKLGIRELHQRTEVR